MDTALLILKISVVMVAFKALVGFHFPWEKCQCCGHKWRDHIKTRGVVSSIKTEEEYYFDTVYIRTSNGITGLHIDKCVDFDPEVGDFVEVNELDWTIRKI